jgi:hypothetical protein
MLNQKEITMAKPENPGAHGRENAQEHGGHAHGPGGNPDAPLEDEVETPEDVDEDEAEAGPTA